MFAITLYLTITSRLRSARKRAGSFSAPRAGGRLTAPTTASLTLTRRSTRSFKVHHEQRMSLAAVKNNAMAIRKQLLCTAAPCGFRLQWVGLIKPTDEARNVVGPTWACSLLYPVVAPIINVTITAEAAPHGTDARRYAHQTLEQGFRNRLPRRGDQ